MFSCNTLARIFIVLTDEKEDGGEAVKKSFTSRADLLNGRETENYV